MTYIRKGMNKRNFEYWYNVAIEIQKKPHDIARLFAENRILYQEIDMLKERLRKLEKRL